MKLIKEKTNFDFMKYRKISGIASITFVILSIISLSIKQLNFGIDFTGGTLVELHYQNIVKLDSIRDKLEKAGYENAQVKYYGSAKDVHIYIAPTEAEKKAEKKDQSSFNLKSHDDTGRKILVLLKSTSDKPIELRRSDFVGSQVGQELTEDGGLALLAALLCILLYVAFRFMFKFAAGSVIALFHDVIITLGFFSITGMEFDLSVLAALLAVIGYSLNDTIVVFDRIRENFRRMRKGTPIEIMNAAINETLSRTIMTSFTTLLVLIALLIFGGEVIRGFSVALIIGIVVGTYSSIFVASNAALFLGISRDDLIEVKKEGAHIQNDTLP